MSRLEYLIDYLVPKSQRKDRCAGDPLHSHVGKSQSWFSSLLRAMVHWLLAGGSIFFSSFHS